MIDKDDYCEGNERGESKALFKLFFGYDFDDPVESTHETKQQMKELLDINIIILKGGLNSEDNCLAFGRLRDIVCKCMNKTWEEIKRGQNEKD